MVRYINVNRVPSFEEYQNCIKHYFSTDNRELNYQNHVIIPLLEKLFDVKPGSEISIVDVSTLYRNWDKCDWHDRSKYAGTYTPDVLVAKNWNLKNKGKTDIEYLLLIEIKTPNAGRRGHAIAEVSDYLNRVPNVILTDGITWEFYTKSLDKSCIYYLEDGENKVCERKQATHINWKPPHDDIKGWTALLKKLKDVVGIKE